jgi:hypothetical protein
MYASRSPLHDLPPDAESGRLKMVVEDVGMGQVDHVDGWFPYIEARASRA